MIAFNYKIATRLFKEKCWQGHLCSMKLVLVGHYHNDKRNLLYMFTLIAQFY